MTTDSACGFGFGIGGLRFRGCPRFVPHSTDPANPAKSHEPPTLPDLPDLPKRCALPILHPVRAGAKHRFETKTRVPRRSAALTRQKSAHRTTLRFAWDCPDIARNPRRAWRLVFRAFLTSARTWQTQSRPRRKALVRRISDPFPRPPNLADPALRKPRGGPALFYICAENPGNDFGGLSVAK